MRIGAAEVRNENGQARIGALAEYAGRRQHLWYSVDSRYGRFLTSEKLDGFVVALLPLAMEHGEDVTIEGAISEKLFYNLTHYYIPILQAMTPSLRAVRLLPERLDCGETSSCDCGVATGFSGGIDSFAVLADHLFGDVPPAFRITHLVFNNVGSCRSDALFHSRYSMLSGFPREAGLEFVKIDSNLRAFLGIDPLTKNFLLTHVQRNVSAVLMLQKLLGKYLYASSYTYSDCSVSAGDDIARTDPFAVHLLSTETLDCISAGCQYSRVEKTARVTQVEPSRKYLNVCVGNTDRADNCSTCRKCARTLLTLELLGKEHLYSSVFDLTAYKRIRDRYIRSALVSGDPLQKEIAEFAREKGFPFSMTQKVFSSTPARVLRSVAPGSVRKAVIRLIGFRD